MNFLFKADLISFIKHVAPFALYVFYFLTNMPIYEKYTLYIFIGKSYISII
jgi:hypothetical protein